MRIMIVALLISTPVVLHAQRRCVKGIPCGGTCISATKTCRVGAPPASEPTRADAPSGAQSVRRDSAVSETPRGNTGDPEQDAFLRRLRGDRDPYIPPGPFVGSVDDNIYYATGCLTAATKITVDERVYFKSEQEAVAKGYRRSKAKGC